MPVVNIYVANLPYSTTDADLQAIFAAHGSVQKASVVMDRETGRSRGFGFVEMTNDDEGRAAITKLNGQAYSGRPLIVNEAKPREPRSGGAPGSRFSGAGGSRGGYAGGGGESRGGGYAGGGQRGGGGGGGGFSRPSSGGYAPNPEADPGFSRGGGRDRGKDRDRDKSERDSDW